MTAAEAPAPKLDRKNALRSLDALALALDLLRTQREDDAGARPLSFDAQLLASLDGRACAGLSWALRNLEGDLGEALASGRVAQMDGMNAPLLAVVDDALHGRAPALLHAAAKELPPGILELAKLKGLGPKKIAQLWRELQITSLGELEYACTENRLVTLKGFGDKTQESLLGQLAELRAHAGTLRLHDARELGERAARALHARGDRAATAGDARRAVELCAGVDVVTTASEARVREVASAESWGQGTVDGDAVRFGVGGSVLRVFHSIASAGWGRALVERTGPAAHVEALRARTASGSPWEELPAENEDDVYAALRLYPTPPERRDDAAAVIEVGRARPALITRGALKGALHNHTTASDGTASLGEMQAAAQAMGLRYLAITEHSESAFYARGLAAAALQAQRQSIAALNAAAAGPDGCVLLHGVESDIRKDGDLDYPSSVLADLDVVVASVHNRFGQRGPDLTARMCTAARHPHTDIVGHPTGRLLLGRAPAEYDVFAFLEACRAAGCAVELNANPARLDLAVPYLVHAKALGIPVSIAADAHSVEALGHLELGVAVARRAGLCEEDVLNTRALPELLTWLNARRGRSAAQVS